MTHTETRTTLSAHRGAAEPRAQGDRKRGSAAKAETRRRRQARADKRGAR